MSAAIAAAASAPALTVRIVSPTDWDNDGLMDDAPRAGEMSFDLRFSDDIAGDADNTSEATAQLRRRLLDVLRIGGVPAVLAAQSADDDSGVDFGGSSTDCNPDVVTVNLVSPLTAGQSIAIADTTLQFGARSDRRPLARSSVSVVRKEVRAPTFEIISIIGQTSFTVIAKDNQNTDTGLADGETLLVAEITATSRGDDLSVSGVSGGAVDTPSGRVTEHTFTVTVDRALVSSDRITIAKDANKPVSFEVLVDTTGKRAFITFVNGKPKFADLAAALRSHSGFNGLWDVSVDNVQNACTPANKEMTVGAAVTLTGDQVASADKVRDGNTKMAIEATFSGHVAVVHSNELLADVFAATVLRVPTAALSDIGLGGEEDITGPVRTARWVASTEDVTRLPKSGDRYNVEADTIADGYADNNPDTTDIDESKNRAQTNLSISSGGTVPR